MNELMEYRRNLIERLTEAAREFRSACEAVRDPSSPVEQGWNVHQLAAHTRDVDRLVYGLRVQGTVEMDNPEFKNFDADAWAAEQYDSNEPMQKILDEFTVSVSDLVEFLRGLPPEAWSRESRHETLGSGFTMQAWVERGLAHIEEHLGTVKKAK